MLGWAETAGRSLAASRVALSGYPPRDLLERAAFVQAACAVWTA